MGRKACTKPQCLYKGVLYFYFNSICQNGGFFNIVTKLYFPNFTIHLLTGCVTISILRKVQLCIVYCRLLRIVLGLWLINSIKAKLNPICHLLALLEAHHNLHVSGIRVKEHKKVGGYNQNQEDSWDLHAGKEVIDRVSVGRVHLKCDGTRWRTEGEGNGKLANGMGSQYPSHYLGTWCIYHYYRWCAHFLCQ